MGPRITLLLTTFLVLMTMGFALKEGFLANRYRSMIEAQKQKRQYGVNGIRGGGGGHQGGNGGGGGKNGGKSGNSAEYGGGQMDFGRQCSLDGCMEEFFIKAMGGSMEFDFDIRQIGEYALPFTSQEDCQAGVKGLIDCYSRELGDTEGGGYCGDCQLFDIQAAMGIVDNPTLTSEIFCYEAPDQSCPEHVIELGNTIGKLGTNDLRFGCRQRIEGMIKNGSEALLNIQTNFPEGCKEYHWMTYIDVDSFKNILLLELNECPVSYLFHKCEYVVEDMYMFPEGVNCGNQFENLKADYKKCIRTNYEDNDFLRNACTKDGRGLEEDIAALYDFDVEIMKQQCEYARQAADKMKECECQRLTPHLTAKTLDMDHGKRNTKARLLKKLLGYLNKHGKMNKRRGK